MTPEQRAQQLARMKAWRDANKEKRAAYMKRWRAENAEHVKATQKAYDESRAGRPRKHRYRPIPKDETPEARAARLARERDKEARYMARLRADPERYAAWKARKAEERKRKNERIKADPELYEADKARLRAKYLRYMERLKADPERYERYRKRDRGYIRAYVKRNRTAAPKRPPQPQPGELFRKQLYQDVLYAEVAGKLAHMRPGDAKDDLIAEAIILMLEGQADAKQAIKEARKALGKDNFKTVSMDAPNQYGNTLHDYLTECIL